MTEQDSSRIFTDLFYRPRTESPLVQVYTEGTVPVLRVQFEEWAIATINKFLDGIQYQWLNYGQGPEMFHNHGINPGQHQAAIINRIRRVIAAQETEEPTSRASSPMSIPPTSIKMEGQESRYLFSTPTKGKEPLKGDRGSPMDAGNRWGLASNMPNRPTYLSGRNLDIICHMYGNQRGAAILHQMARDHAIASGNRTLSPRHAEDDRENEIFHRHWDDPQGGGEDHPQEGYPGRGPPSNDDDENNDPDDDNEDDEDGEPLLWQISARPVGGRSANRQSMGPQQTGHQAQQNYLRGFTPGNDHYMGTMQQ
ncbi:hypothetical protein L210DRAFT_861846 [Boletus edulis BED1]|uniref:Uncharacterized protein n=1 Tax=Boletus edulis BED1 TaxID=1328754 RepID=A0AAD4GGX5_BOLED|nr:hypothetical protein L210DRAFT_861846 [Boletus edulis BED1]